MGSDSTWGSKPNKKYGDEKGDETYTGKIKGGLNQASDYLKTAYNKANFTDFGGYIKDKVTNQ
jgi:hypothetical protein